MIAVALAGGLGNLLFEYAFIYSLHHRLKTNFFLMNSGAPILLYKYFHVEKNLFYYTDLIFFNHHGFKLFFSHYLKGFFTSLFTKSFAMQKVVVDNRDDPSAILHAAKDGVVYEGYFQSECYFKAHGDELKNLLKIRKKYVNLFDQKFKWLNEKKKIITVHIRRTDYQTAFGYLALGAGDLTLPMRYYHRLIEQIHTPDNFYVFISDDIAFLKEEFDYLPNKFLSQENEIIDFQLMQNADTCIIANSSFSWWAAYLNKKKAEVYCPKNYLGFLIDLEYPNQIYPENWIQIQVK